MEAQISTQGPTPDDRSFRQKYSKRFIMQVCKEKLISLLPVFFVLERNESKLYLLKDYQSHIHVYTVKPVLSGHSKRRPKLVFKTGYRLMQVQSIAECPKPWNILQYFRPSLSYHMSLISLFCLFLSDRLRQILLYHYYVVVV